jgi:hypothetical protein
MKLNPSLDYQLKSWRTMTLLQQRKLRLIAIKDNKKRKEKKIIFTQSTLAQN